MKRIGLDISVLSEQQKTGIGVYTYELIKALLMINKKDKFILFGLATFKTYHYLKNLEFKNCPNVEMKIFRMPAKFFRTAFLTWQKLDWPPVEKFVGPLDIFHSFNWFMPPQRGGKKVATVFDLTSILFPSWHSSRTSQLDQLRFERIVKQANLTVTISKNSKKDFLKFNPEGKVEVVYPAVGAQFNTKIDQVETKKILQKYHLEPNFFLSVSTLEPRKNLKNLIEAYLETGIKNPLILVGKMGWKNKEIVELIEKNGQKVKHLGFIKEEDLPILYQQALCLIYPSYYEGFGLPILEAQACGTPVICSNSSSLPEVGGQAAVYVNPNSLESIKKALIEIKSNPKLRKFLSREGLKQAQKFSWEKSAQKLNSLYQKL